MGNSIKYYPIIISYLVIMIYYKCLDSLSIVHVNKHKYFPNFSIIFFQNSTDRKLHKTFIDLNSTSSHTYKFILGFTHHNFLPSYIHRISSPSYHKSSYFTTLTHYHTPGHWKIGKELCPGTRLYALRTPSLKGKTNKSVAKRFKITAGGKWLRRHAGKQHKLSKKSSAVKRRLSTIQRLDDHHRKLYQDVVMPSKRGTNRKYSPRTLVSPQGLHIKVEDIIAGRANAIPIIRNIFKDYNTSAPI